MMGAACRARDAHTSGAPDLAFSIGGGLCHSILLLLLSCCRLTHIRQADAGQSNKTDVIFLR